MNLFKFTASTLLVWMGLGLTSTSAQGLVREDGPDISDRAELEFEKVRDPATGKIPAGAHWRALIETKQANEFYLNTNLRTTALSWVERGPYTDVVGPSNGNTRANSGVTAGRIRTILIDASDATGKTVWVGGVDGGLWKTTDITLSPANWVVVNDYLSNLAVTDITQDPTNPNIMYFCTGESYYNADAVAGVGVFKSTDNGVTWSQLTGTSNYTYCSRILCDYQGNVYLATRGNGLQRSGDGGVTWSSITPSGMSTNICDLEISSTTGPARLHVVGGIFSTQSYRYTDIPATATSSTGWVAPVTAFPSYSQRAEIACAGNVLYACPVDGSYQVPAIYKSTDGGSNWTSTAGQPTSGWASGQGWYSINVVINPTNTNECIVGGLDNHRTLDGGATWTKISNWVGTSGQYVHADQHDAVWYDNGNKLIFACDGGIHFSSDKGTTIRDRNIGLRLKQFYSVATHPTTTDFFLAGAQDNGTHKLTSAGLSGSVEVTGGDGAYVAIDQNQPQYQFGAYVYNQYRRSTDGGNSWSSINFSSSAGKFINPFAYDNTANKLYAAHNAGSYLRWDDPQTGSTSTTVAVSLFGSARVSAVHVSPFTANRVYFGTDAGKIIQVNNAHLATPSSVQLSTASMPAAYISCVNTGTSEQYLIACYSNYGVTNVWVSTDGGLTWTGIDGNLPNMPVRWCMFEPNDNTGAIIATETGVWETSLIAGSNTTWIPSLNFPKVRTDMLAYRASDGMLAAGTHGRGIFSTSIPMGTTCNAPLGLSSSSVTATTAVLSWTSVNGAIGYTVNYRISGAPVWTNAATATSSTSVTLSGLQSSTLYEWQVKTLCNGDSSAYSTAQFTTLAPFVCNAPSGLTAGSITATSATLSWTAVSGAISYAVDYKLTSTSTWTPAGTAIPSTAVNLSGLTPSSTYDFRVSTNCSGSSSPFSSAQFTTAAQVACPGPYDISTNGTYTGAAVIPFNTAILGAISSSTDNDYYKFTISTQGTATVTLSNLPANYNLIIYRSNGTTSFGSSSNTGTASETISKTFKTGVYYIKVSGVSGAFNATSCYTLQVSLGTATTPEALFPMHNEATVVKLYPNPAKNELHVSTVHQLDENSFLTIFSVTGAVVYESHFSGSPQVIDISALKPGSYYLRSRTAEGEGVYRFIKE